jgi:Glycosyl hydrolase family 76
MVQGGWKRSSLVRLAVAASVTAAAATGIVVATDNPSRAPVPAPLVAPQPNPAPFVSNALREAGAMRRTFAAGHGLLVETRPAKVTYSTLWPASQAVNALIAVEALDHTGANVTRANSALRSLNNYWDPNSSPPGYDSIVRPPLGGGGAKFYDDNVWVALDLLQAYRLNHDAALLRRAERVFTFIKHGWDSRPGSALPGGIFWTQRRGNHDRTLAANAGGAQVALELYMLTGKKPYLSQAQSILDWVNASLRSPDGLFWDHVDLQGDVTHAKWSYNQGLMIGAYALMYQATGDPVALYSAVQIADAALSKAKISAQPAQFEAIFFKNLLLLDTIQPNPVYRRAIERYAARMQVHVDSHTGLVRSRGAKTLLGQAGVTEVNAYLAMALEGKTGLWTLTALH